MSYFKHSEGSVLVLLLCLFFVSCTKEQSSSVTVVKDIQVTDTLHGQLVIDSEKVVFSPWAFAVCGDRFLTYTPDKELLFDLWDLNDNCKHISEFGYEGRAANEFNQVIHTSLVTTDSSFSVFCAGDMAYKTVQVKGDAISSMASLSDFVPEFNIDRVKRIDDSVFVCTSSNLKYEFMWTNIKTGKVTFFGKITDDWFCPSLPENERQSAMASNQCVDPSTGSMAVFYANFKKIRFYDSSLNLVRDIDVQIEPYDGCFDGSKSTGSYLFPYATSESIYVICSKSSTHRDVTESELQIWDWAGNLKYRYMLDKGIFHIVYYPKRNIILGETVGDELYEFQLPR